MSDKLFSWLLFIGFFVVLGGLCAIILSQTPPPPTQYLVTVSLPNGETRTITCDNYHVGVFNGELAIFTGYGYEVIGNHPFTAVRIDYRPAGL